MDPRISLAVLGFVASLAAWVFAEWRGEATIRRVSAVASITLTAIVAYHVGWLGPQYSINWYEQSLERIRLLAEAEDPDAIAQAIVTYQSSHPPSEPDPIFLLRELSRE